MTRLLLALALASCSPHYVQQPRAPEPHGTARILAAREAAIKAVKQPRAPSGAEGTI